MKKKKLNKVLELNKKTISNLHMSRVRGGCEAMDTHIKYCDSDVGHCHTDSCVLGLC